ncbi:MAG: APC family permease [Clostridiales Family XIII bacterium]|jgi:amino acid transporter|nr:APC family permease [Clostridiales Family XIII bacterium]
MDKNKGGGSPPTGAPSGTVEQFGYKQELQRVLTLKDLIVYGMLFIIIIAPFGIFGEVNVVGFGMAPMVYLVGLCAMIFTALGYMQMSNRFPIAGSVYSYVQRGINPHIGFMTGWLILVDYILIPTLNYGLAGVWLHNAIPQVPSWVFIFAMITMNSFINYRGITLMKVLDWVVFAVEILVVIIFVFLGVKFLLSGGGFGGFTIKPFYNPEFFNMKFIATAATVACLSFLGFDAISTLSEETREPEKNVGRATVLTLLIVGGIFILITYIASSVWGARDLAELDPESGIYQIANEIGGEALELFLLGVMVIGSIFGSLTAQAAMTRVLFSMSRDGLMPKFMSKIHAKHKTPYLTVVFVAVFMFIVSFVPPMQLVRFVNFGGLTSFIVLNFAVFWFFFIREKRRHSFGDYVKFLICPVIGMTILGYVWSGFDKPTLILGFSWLAVGVVVAAIKTKGFKEVPEAFRNMSL